MVVELIRKVGRQRNLSPRTIKTYICVVQKFLRIYRKDVHSIKKKDIENHLKRVYHKSGSTQNVHLSALKFLFEKVLNKRLTVNIPMAKENSRLPGFLTKQEVSQLLSVIYNKKHKLMVTLLYSAGMRVSELVHLKVKHFHFDSNFGWVRNGKGGKDRIFIIAQLLRDELQQWIKQNNLKEDDWLFKGHKFQMTTSAVREILKSARRRAKINKHVHPHMLRHSFATHLIENGYAVTDVQPLLGHKNLETTLIYTHLAAPKLLNIKSPFDSLQEIGQSNT
tara:strand:+ start:881 stop:1717 length:837 start_codon:yes stop_codon:yes gene_type:complete